MQLSIYDTTPIARVSNGQSGSYPMPTTYASALFPAYYFDPPAGSNWALILGAWDGVPGSLLGPCILSGNYDVSGWRANCSAVTTEPPGAGLDNAIAVPGDDIGPGYSYPFALTGISNPDLTIEIMPLSNGSVAGHATSGENMSTFSMLAIAAISAGAGAIVGAAVAGAGAATAAGSGATAMSSSDVSTIYGSAGYGDAAATVPTTESVVPTVAATDTGASIPTVTSSALDSAPSAASSATAASNAGESQAFIDASDNSLTNTIAAGAPSSVPVVTASDLVDTGITSVATSLPSYSVAATAAPGLPTAGGASSLLPTAGSLVKGLEGALSNLTNSASAAGTSGEWSLTTGGNTGVVIGAMAIAFLLLRKK